VKSALAGMGSAAVVAFLAAVALAVALAGSSPRGQTVARALLVAGWVLAFAVLVVAIAT
jgi:hypothetical protein